MANNGTKQIAYLFQSGEDYHLDALDEEKLFFTHPRHFNDPYDCDIEIKNDLGDDHRDQEESTQNHLITDLKPVFKKYHENGLDGKWDSELLGSELAGKIAQWCDDHYPSDILIKNIEDRIKNDIGVRCMFRDEPDSTMMWAHYAGNHTGYCLKYSMEPFLLQDVIYTTNPNEYYLSEFLFSSRTTINTATRQKNSCWAHENEVRIIRTNPEQEQSGAGFKLPLSDFGCKLEAIYLGRAIDNAKKERLIGISQKFGVELLECEKDEFDTSKFKLVKPKQLLGKPKQLYRLNHERTYARHYGGRLRLRPLAAPPCPINTTGTHRHCISLPPPLSPIQ